MPIPPSMFPTWPAKSEMLKGKKREKSPKPPSGGQNNLLVSSLLFCLPFAFSKLQDYLE